MVLIDTSVWVDYIRFGNDQLAQLLQLDRVLMHDMVLGEMACGSLQQRTDRLAILGNLPRIDMAEHAEVLDFIERHQLFGCGIGYVDNHLLAAVTLRVGCKLWSSDKRLMLAAQRLGIAWDAVAH
jgi:predicted nucleic acid-binding protein